MVSQMDKMETSIIWQLAIIVKDIEKTVENYAKIFGINVPQIFDSALEENSFMGYNGNEIKPHYKMAFIKMGLLQLELIEPSEEPSSWRDFLNSHGDGIHHVAFNVNDVDSCINLFGSQGMPLLQEGIFDGGSYHYIDAQEKLGLVVELSQKKKK